MPREKHDHLEDCLCLSSDTLVICYWIKVLCTMDVPLPCTSLSCKAFGAGKDCGARWFQDGSSWSFSLHGTMINSYLRSLVAAVQKSFVLSNELQISHIYMLKLINNSVSVQIYRISSAIYFLNLSWVALPSNGHDSWQDWQGHTKNNWKSAERTSKKSASRQETLLNITKLQMPDLSLATYLWIIFCTWTCDQFWKFWQNHNSSIS